MHPAAQATRGFRPSPEDCNTHHYAFTSKFASCDFTCIRQLGSRIPPGVKQVQFPLLICDVSLHEICSGPQLHCATLLRKPAASAMQRNTGHRIGDDRKLA